MKPHRLFLSHSGADTAAAIRLAERIERSSDGAVEVWIDKSRLVPGASWKAQIQDALDRSTAFAVYVGSSGTANWVWDEVSVALDRAHREPTYPVIPVLARDGNIDALPSFLRQHQGVQNVEESAEEFATLMRAVLRQRVPQERAIETEPFQGLEAFDSGRAHLFFGREHDVDAVLAILRDEPLVMIVGDSGCGKSSLVKAGVVPRFLGGALAPAVGDARDRTVWQVLQTRPSSDPFSQLAESIRSTAQRRHILPTASSELADLVRTRQPAKIRDAILMLAHHEGTGDSPSSTLLVVDQFEELFTLASPDAQTAFADVLLALVDGAAEDVRVVLTMRWDYYQLLAVARPLYERLESKSRLARYALRRMSDENLRRCITEPLKLAGIDEGPRTALAAAILGDVGDRPNDLALLEMALWQTWVKRALHGGDLLRTYVEIGRVDGALANAADEALARLTPEERALAESLFIRLVKLGDAGGATRRVAQRAELGPDRWQLAQKLATREYKRLVVVSETTVEVSHEAIVLSWPQFRKWLRNDPSTRDSRADDKRRLDVLADSAMRWAGQRENPDVLARGSELAEYEALAARRPGWLSDGERRFLAGSAAARSAAHQRMWLMRTTVAAAAVLVVAVAVAGFALVLRSPASAWVATGLSGVIPESTALVVRGGRESIRAMAPYFEGSLDDDSGGTSHLMFFELDLRGRRTGCFAYVWNEGFSPREADCKTHGGPGSLAEEVRQISDTERGNSEFNYGVHLLRNQTRPRRYAGPTAQAVKERVTQAARAGTALAPDTRIENVEVFAVTPDWLQAFVTVTNEYETGTLPLRSTDEGQTWAAGRIAEQISVHGITGLAQGHGGRTLFLTTRDNRVPGSPDGRSGALFRSDDSGSTWERQALTDEWATWPSFASVAAHPERPGEIAVALHPEARSVRSRPPNVPGVLVSTDDGRTWRALETALRTGPRTEIMLAGMARSGEIVAVLDEYPTARPAAGGPLVVWRDLSILERLQGRF
jgi:hypothetical protein